MESTAIRPRRRFTVEDYYRMAEAGILGEDDRVELIEGEIVEMPPIGSPHAGTVDHLAALLSRAIGDRAMVRTQGPIRLSDLTEPVPDVSLLRPRDDWYRRGHPAPQDVLLLVEVAETSAAFDRDVKAPLYARAGITEYWIVDLPRGLVVVHRGPTPDGYEERVDVASGGVVTPAALPDITLDVAEILGN